MGDGGKTDRRFPARRFSVALLAIGAGLLSGVPAAGAAELAVTNDADSGAGSLRQAVAGAAGGDTIRIYDGADPTLTSGEITIDKSITIVGQGAGATIINADNSPPPDPTFRVFTVTGGATVTFRYLTINGGRAPPGETGPTGGAGGNGGGILAEAHVILDWISVGFNRAGNGGSGDSGGVGGSGGAVYSTPSGSITISNSLLTANFAGNGGTGVPNPGGTGGEGGGIYSNGPLAIFNSTINTNQAGRAGGSIFSTPGTGGAGGGVVHAGGDAFISGTTISGNVAGAGANNSNPNGVAGNGGDGGGLVFDGAGSLTLINSSVVGNLAGPGGHPFEEGPFVVGPGHGGNGGGISFDGSPGSGNIINATIINNVAGVAGEPGETGEGGGIFAAGDASKLALRNTLLITNFAIPADHGPTCAGAAIVDGGSSIGFPADPHCPPGLSAVDPMLDPFGLRRNGGTTRTIALMSGSPAIDAAASCTNASGGSLTTDQRGLPRPAGSACDIGAYERQPGESPAGPRSAGPTRKQCRKRGKKLVKRKGKRRCVKKKKKKKKKTQQTR